jgi:integrase
MASTLSRCPSVSLDASRRHDPFGLVFSSQVGSPLRDGDVGKRVLKPAAIRAGLLRPREAWFKADKPESWVGFHTFRHTCASLLFADGKNVKQVQEWLGHADPGFTLRTYVHLMDDGLGDAEFFDHLEPRDTDQSRPAEAVGAEVA